MNYSADWPCKCNHTYEDHGVAFGHTPTRKPCLVTASGIRSEYSLRPQDPYIDECEDFDPVSNLEYLESKHGTNLADISR